MISVMYFSTTWCGPCKIFWPTVEEICSATNTPVQKIDAEQSPDLASQHQITGVPTLIILKTNQPVFRNTGVMPKTKLIETLQNLS